MAKAQELKSNYDIMRDRMETEFLNYDQAAMIRKYGLEADEEYIYINMISCPYRVGRKTGMVERRVYRKEYIHADYNESMTIFDVLCYAKEGVHTDGRFAGINELTTAQTSSPGKSMFKKTADYFTNHCDELRTACHSLGGFDQGKGDVACIVPLFDFLPVQLIFWDADDEFDASLQFLWDRNTLSFMHYETTFFALGVLTRRLKEQMNLEKT